MSIVMWSERGYCRMRGIEKNPLASISLENKEEISGFSPGSVV